MFRLLLPVFLVLGLFFYWKMLKHATPEERSRRLKGIGSVAAMLVAAVFALRAGSWGWAVGGLLAIIALRAIPYLTQVQAKPSESVPPSNVVPPRGPMSRAEAVRILDLSEPFTTQDVQTRYREIMRGVHPDRGGSTHLAAQVNAAYQLLTSAPNSGKRS